MRPPSFAFPKLFSRKVNAYWDEARETSRIMKLNSCTDRIGVDVFVNSLLRKNL